MEIAEAVGLSVDSLHFVVKAFGDSVVTSEAPHSNDLLGPGSKSIAELHQLRQAGLAQLVNRAQETGYELLALFAGAVLFKQQIAEALLEAVDQLQYRMGGQVSCQFLLLLRAQVMAVAAHQ